MLEVFKATRKGFNQKMEVGELIEYKDEQYIIIGISNMRINSYGDPYVTCDLMCQSIKYAPDPTIGYREYTTYTQRHKIAQQNDLFKHRKILDIGTILPIVDKKTTNKILYQIYGIEKFVYEHVDLLVTYQINIIRPWSHAEIEQAVRKNRLSKFTVLGNTI
ncbi:hypothetical protein NNC41_08030 [Enterococcus faecium]|nr:hypothetical protein [Enterococcus faecium]HAQ1518030.1 hypothetical protein [Enterococcus faecium]